MEQLDGRHAQNPGHDERLLRLRDMAETRNAWRSQRRVVVCELADWVEEGEGLSELRAAQDDIDVVVALVTDRRLLIGRHNDRTGAVHVEPITLDYVVAASTDAKVAGDLRITWTDGVTEINGLSSSDAQRLLAAIRQRMRSATRSVLTRRRERKPATDLELLDSLRASGILTSEEVSMLRHRVIRDIAARAQDSEGRPGVRAEDPARR